MDKLKPCPFCGGEAMFSEAHTDNEGRFYIAYVQCKKCRIKIIGSERITIYGWPTQYEYKVSNEAAIEAWNKRAEPWRGEES